MLSYPGKKNSLQFMILNHKSAQSLTFNKKFLSILTAIILH